MKQDYLNRKKNKKKGRAPQGARGLKQPEELQPDYVIVSRPPGGAWIETASAEATNTRYQVAPPRGRVD